MNIKISKRSLALVLLWVIALANPVSVLAVEKKPSIYDTTLQIAPDGQPKHKLVLFWSASDPKLQDLYIKIVEPVIKNREKTSTVLLLSQIYTNRDIFGPGSLLLCATDSKLYSMFVQAYPFLLKHSEFKQRIIGPGKNGEKYEMDSALQWLEQKSGISFENCINDDAFLERQAYMLKTSELVYAEYPKRSLPILILDDKMIDQSDERLHSLIETK